MDSISEKRLIAELLNKHVGGWEIHDRLGAGKSAVVFSASKEGATAALKVFDPELVERSGRQQQLKRIGREVSLRDKTHPNLVRILDGGECAETHHLFVAMERIDAPNLAEALQDIPRQAIKPIIAQVAEAARFLESLSPPVAHRDIKPDNIAVSADFQKATLLDLGVILPIDLKDSEPPSDQDRRFFVGTLRYGPPEFLLRKEEYSVEGWRAVTFYQLGAVLYDLIMKERIFEAFAEPYPRLVMAVEHEIPTINSKEVPEELILLAKNCLNKDPAIRLKYLSWGDFELKTSMPTAAMSAKERVRRRLAGTGTEAERASAERNRLMLRAVQEVQSRLHNLIKSGWASSEMFCPIECIEHSEIEPSKGVVALVVQGAKNLLLAANLRVWFSIRIVDERSLFVEIDYTACLSDMAPSVSEALNQSRPKSLFAGVFQEGVVQQMVMDLLYQLIDLAQSFSEVQATAESRWLELVSRAPQ